MRIAIATLACCLALALGCTERDGSETSHDEIARSIGVGVEAISLLGDTLRPVSMPDEVRAARDAALDAARQNHEADPHNIDALIWYGRRTAYLGDYRDAIHIYSTGIDDQPDDARLYRHRGHRYISVRDFDKAIADFERATQLIAGRPDEVEPDGQPNTQNIPTSTLQSNIWYHLGLAYYLTGRFDDAKRAYQACMLVSKNNDMMVATAYWQYMTLQRTGDIEAAAAVLARISPDMDLFENHTYHRLLLLFKGELTESDIVDTGASSDTSLANATAGYGVGAWHLLQGHPDQANAVWRRTLGDAQWPAFGFIASEAELARGG